MNFAFDEEQAALRQSARRFLVDHGDRRSAMETGRGWDPALWGRISEQLGWPGLTIPERYGGFDFGQVGVTAVMEEMGRALACTPFFATVCLGVNALLEGDDEGAREAWLPRIASGDATATVAHSGGSLRVEAGRLRGERALVVDGHTADLVVAVTDDGAMYAVPGERLERAPLGTMDKTRRMARVGFDVAVSSPLGGDPTRVLDLARAALSAEQVGGAEACLEMAVEYAKVRVQFGRAIGSFQAIKHKCADMLVLVESARSAAYYAGWAAACAPDELSEAAAVASAFCSEAFFRCAGENIQIHGGVGFTWEHDAHLYFKRARSSESYLGDPSYHRERVAAHLGL